MPGKIRSSVIITLLTLSALIGITLSGCNDVPETPKNLKSAPLSNAHGGEPAEPTPTGYVTLP
jgi:hypothetical protein